MARSPSKLETKPSAKTPKYDVQVGFRSRVVKGLPRADIPEEPATVSQPRNNISITQNPVQTPTLGNFALMALHRLMAEPCFASGSGVTTCLSLDSVGLAVSQLSEIQKCVDEKDKPYQGRHILAVNSSSQQCHGIRRRVEASSRLCL